MYGLSSNLCTPEFSHSITLKIRINTHMIFIALPKIYKHLKKSLTWSQDDMKFGRKKSYHRSSMTDPYFRWMGPPGLI